MDTGGPKRKKRLILKEHEWELAKAIVKTYFEREDIAVAVNIYFDQEDIAVAVNACYKVQLAMQ